MEDTSWRDIASKEFAKRRQQQSQGEHAGGVPRAHHRFSIKDGDTILQVENALFRVHSHFLVKHSAVLSDTLSLPKPNASDTSPQNGLTYGHIQLTGDSVLGWECLLGLFYPDDPCQPVSYTAKEWAAVVLLANKYMMEGIEASALNRLRKTKPALNNADLVMLAQKVGSEELYQEALQSLADQNQMVSIGDAEKIGLKAFHAVMTSVTEQVYADRRMVQHPQLLEWGKLCLGAGQPFAPYYLLSGTQIYPLEVDSIAYIQIEGDFERKVILEGEATHLRAPAGDRFGKVCYCTRQALLAMDADYETGVPRPHHRFDVQDGDTVLQVNNALFRVHRHFLIEHSIILSDTLSLPRPNPSGQSVVTDRHIRLSGDTVFGWECLLGLFYPKDPCQPVTYAAEQWAAVVLLANKYLMEGIELSALHQLQRAKPSLDMVDLMVLAQKVDSQDLYQTALHHLAQRDQMLSLEDARKIGVTAFHDVVTMEHVYFTRGRRPMQRVPTTTPVDSLSDSDTMPLRKGRPFRV